MRNIKKSAAELEIEDSLYLALKGARERLIRAQSYVDYADIALLQGAIDRIDLVAVDLPQWSRFDGTDPRR
jgi:hypothetical protein